MAGQGNGTHRARGSEDFGVFDDAKTYYASDERHTNRFGPRTRTYSQVNTQSGQCLFHMHVLGM
jgi:alpha,alpha-trehalase